MQFIFDFGTATDIVQMREALRSAFAGYTPSDVREPIGQLVKSMISSRTRDAVSLAAYQKLVRRYPRWADLASAPQSDIERVIHDVTFAADKASYLKDALSLVARSHDDFDLSFLKRLSVPKAIAWLEALPGAGRKVAASTLNFSTLAMPAFVVDLHVLRVLARFGVVGARADIETAYDAVMAAVPGWSAFELSEFHVLTKRLGQLLCRFDMAECGRCPIARHCRFAAASQPGRQEAGARTPAVPAHARQPLVFPERT